MIVCPALEQDYLVYRAMAVQGVRKLSCSVHAYCLMTNHIHILMTMGLHIDTRTTSIENMDGPERFGREDSDRA